MSGFKVLLAEDESVTALQIKNKLKSWDFNVVAVASSGEEAIKMALEKKPDIVILDIILKGNLDGIDAAEKIKDVLDIPIIYLTAFADESTMDRAMSTEPKNYIIKPFDDNELRFALEMSVYRNKIENELKKTQNYLELITENMGDIVGQVDTKGVFLYVSPSIKKLLGYQTTNIIGISLFEFVHPEDLEMTLNGFNSCMETGKPQKIRKRLKNFSGDYKWIESMVSPIFDDLDQVKGAVVSCRDIEDQIKIEEELKSALNYSRNLIEVSLDPMVTISENGEIMDVNSATEDSTGLSRKDLVGTDFSQYFTDPEKAMKGYQKTLFYGSLKDYSLTLRHISGRTMDVSFNASVYRNRAGEVEGIFAAARNITKLKKANNALKLSERHFRSLIENALDVIMVLNYQGDITYASPSVEKVFGYKVHEFLGFNIFDFIHHKDSSRLNNALTDDIRSSGSNVVFEVRCQHESGQWLSCQMVAQNLIKDPAVRGIVLNIRDITPRKQAERARNDLEEMYSTLITASPDGFIATDLEGKITYVSDKAAFMMGWSNVQLDSETIFDILIPEEKELFCKNMEIVMKNGALRNIEHKASKKDGEIFVAEMNMALTQNSDGNPKGLIVTIRDITYRKNMEKKIKSSLKEKEILLKEVHHRVKNNMQVISSLIGLQSEKIHDKKTREMFEDSKNRIRSMALIHEKLYGSEGMEKVEFSEYVKSLSESLEKSYSDKINVDIIVDVQDVLLDIDQAITCGLILNELISNSLKYAFPEQTVLDNYSQLNEEMDKNGSTASESGENLNKVSNSFIMPFENPLISVAVCSRGDEVIMHVADNGVGLPDGLNFKETESLGLQIVCTLVAQLEGDINLKDTGGTSFIIKFKQIDSN